MKIIVYLIALGFAHTALAQSSGDGFLGLTLSTTDYTVTAITPDTPAAKSPIHVGDHIVSFGPVPVSQIHTREDFRRVTSGVPGSEIILMVRPAHSHDTIKVRLRRIRPQKIPSDFNRYQVSSDANDLTMRWGGRRTVPGRHLT